jgi:hypothetical protein
MEWPSPAWELCQFEQPAHHESRSAVVETGPGQICSLEASPLKLLMILTYGLVFFLWKGNSNGVGVSLDSDMAPFEMQLVKASL